MQPILDIIYEIILTITGLFMDNPDAWLQCGTNGHPPPIVTILFLLGLFGVSAGTWISWRLNFMAALYVFLAALGLVWGFLNWDWFWIVGSIGVIIIMVKKFGSNKIRDERQYIVQDNDDYKRYKRQLK